ncbi:hypothetical protein [Clostridium saccharobutylicum]|uniref:Uncharacterized protein n=1 Tax=Clostridium saccharobutylicum TaxID=169679 RepID=A0A1S8MZ50_CLOSA|nr:hypothetical protein [Clostridium saccharobutylicum]OOM09457.1 hypothetical protein CLOSAC_37380 [Clostridium saccharobutylicum]
MDNKLIELENALTKKFLNIDIHNYSYANFEELFYLIEELVNKSFIACSYNVLNTSINGGHIHIILKENDHKHALNNKLSVLLAINDFIITNIELSLLH